MSNRSSKSDEGAHDARLPSTDTGKDPEAFFGEPIVSYTSQDAIADGVLVEPFPERFPGWLFTTGVHEAIEGVDDGRSYEQKAIPLIMDAALVVRGQAKRPGCDDPEHLWTEGLDGNVTGETVWIARNDLGGCTLMFPREY